MANVELGSSNLKEVYDAINSNSGGSIDTTNLAKLNEGNIFKEGCTFEKDCLFGGQAVIGKLKSASNPNVMTPKEWATMTDNEVPTKKQIVDNVQGGTVDTSNLAKLGSANTFTAVQTFNNNVNINGILDTGDTNLRGNVTFYSNAIFKNPLVVANNTANQELAITPILNGVSINLGDDCTLVMNAKAISEFKRLLGIS